MSASAIETLHPSPGLMRHERHRARGQVGRLPRPFAQLWAWQEEGACRDAEPWLFYHPDGERGPSRQRRIQSAQAVCSGCPVIQACQDHALAVHEPYGVWGGLTVEDRERIIAGGDLAAVPGVLPLV